MSEDGKCHHRKAAEQVPPLFQNGSVVFQAHHVGWIVSGFFTLVACVISLWLVNKHLTWYTNKREQRHIVRLLFMVPIYAIISFASYLFWNTATPLILIRDGYESIVLASFFYLLLLYVSNDYDEQRLIFLKAGISKEADIEAIRKGEKVRKWCWPFGFIKSKPQDGLYFLQIMKWGILQYSVLRPVTTLAAVILEYAGLYCEISWGPQWGHLYVVLIVSLSVTVAMYCLIQLYLPVAERLKPHKPLLKLFSVKAVVFLTFWQASFLSVLSMAGVVKDGKYMTAEQINIGFGALLQTFEMMLFAIMHLRAFTYHPYRPAQDTITEKPGHSPKKSDGKEDCSDDGRTPRLRSLIHAMNFYETFREIWQGWLYMYDRARGREPRYDANARRAAHLENVLGKGRAPAQKRGYALTEEEEHDRDKAGHSLEPLKKKESERFSEGIERELERREIDPELSIPGHRRRPAENAPDDEAQQSRRTWWWSAYTRVSQSQQEIDDNPSYILPSRRHQHTDNYDDPPPRAISHSRSRSHSVHQDVNEDISDLYSHPDVSHETYAYRPLNLDDSIPRPLSTPSTPKDSLFRRLFPKSDEGSSSMDHFPRTATHSVPSESHNGHSGSRLKTPRFEFVTYSIQTRGANVAQQPIIHFANDSPREAMHSPNHTDAARSIRTSHTRQFAEASPSRPPIPRQSPISRRSQLRIARPQEIRYSRVPYPVTAHRRTHYMPRVLTVPAPLAHQGPSQLSPILTATTSVGQSPVFHNSSANSLIQR